METIFSNIKERVLQLTEAKHVSKEKFFEEIGVTYGNFKGKAKGKALSSDTLATIVAKYPDINSEWLLTGNGHMFKPDLTPEVIKAPQGRFPKSSVQEGRLVPFYDVDFAAGGDIEFYDDAHRVTPSYTMDVPEFSGCTAFRTYGDSMEPLIKPGSILFGTNLHNWHSHLEYGQIYGIVCNDKRKYLKYIRKDKSKENFLLRSENNEYDDFEISKGEIKSIWLIHGWINKRV